MRRETHHFHVYAVPFDAVNDPILVIEPRGAMPAPPPTQALVFEPTNLSESLGPRDYHNVLPFFIPLQDVMREPSDLSIHTSMLENIPH